MHENDFKELFRQAILKNFGVHENLEAIEDSVKHLKDGSPITYEDLLEIANDSLWPFSRFWSWPSREQIEPRLMETKSLLAMIKEDREAHERNVIIKLCQLFKNIGLVSIILRFVFPEYYGIYSPPVLFVARTERGKNEIDDYLNYLEELRNIVSILEIREKYGVYKVSDVDMLLMALSHMDESYLEEFNSIFVRNYKPKKNFLIRISDTFSKSIEKYEKELKGQIFDAIVYLSKKPTSVLGNTILPLKGKDKGKWRYRIRKYRLIYEPNDEKEIVSVLDIDTREDIYDK